ncbi:MAG: hypothetical protein JST83_09535 [Bacteroidetes bacterium]|nr:hypothetical protein [Bacteroidota bacterium]
MLCKKAYVGFERVKKIKIEEAPKDLMLPGSCYIYALSQNNTLYPKSFPISLLLCLLLCGCKAQYDPANKTASFCAVQPSTCDWMHDLVQAHPSASLSQICIPGSHDAGMYIAQYCTAFANHGNTQTQYLTMKNQLEAGLRIYDVRPVLYKGEFYTEHCTRCDGLGCKGDALKNILRDTRHFVDQHQELVILQITHYCHTSPTDTALLNLLRAELGPRIYRNTTDATGLKDFIRIPLEKIIGDDGAGKVLLILEGGPNTPEAQAEGWFHQSLIPMAGGWTNDNHYDELQAHQLRNFAAYTKNGDALFQFCWQITQHNAQAVRGAFDPNSPTTIRKGAAHANAQLPAFVDSLIHAGSIHPGRVPNIIWDDLGDTLVTRQCIKLSTMGVMKKM